MKDLPILFKGEMVRALLNTKPGVWPAQPINKSKPWKWQTRRVVKRPLKCRNTGCELTPGELTSREISSVDTLCPYGGPGTVLWVRETHCWLDEHIDGVEREDPVCVGFPTDGSIYRFEPEPLLISPDRLDDYGNYKLRPSIFMPRWASRIRLEVKEVRCQRVQEITNEDARAEGIGGKGWGCYQMLWDTINAKRGFSWDSNPWVWAVSFMRL